MLSYENVFFEEKSSLKRKHGFFKIKCSPIFFFVHCASHSFYLCILIFSNSWYLSLVYIRNVLGPSCQKYIHTTKKKIPFCNSSSPSRNFHSKKCLHRPDLAQVPSLL